MLAEWLKRNCDGSCDQLSSSKIFESTKPDGVCSLRAITLRRSLAQSASKAVRPFGALFVGATASVRQLIAAIRSDARPASCIRKSRPEPKEVTNR